MWLVKGASDFMQRLSGLPPAPNVTLLDRRKPKPFSRPHSTPPLHTRLTSAGVASTYRMHRANQAVKIEPVYNTNAYSNPTIVLATLTRVEQDRVKGSPLDAIVTVP